MAFLGKVFATIAPGQVFLPNWHLELIGQYLQATQRGEITRLIINMPPRALKSVTVSVAWPAWLLGHDPAAKIVAASYAQSLSDKHSTDCRLVVQSDWYRALFPGTVLSADQNEKHKWVTRERGMRLATSVWGTATGEGGNVLIADDPLNALQGQSAAARQFAADWFHHTFSTRLDDKKRGVIIVVMQRLHAEDVCGRLLARGGWEHLNLPAIAEADEDWHCGGFTHRRGRGELLHPAREGEAEIARARQELGSYHFAAQYLQCPLPEGGGMVKPEWFLRF